MGMKISAQEEYGLRCLLHMAKSGDGSSLSIPDISQAEGLSAPNVAKLMRLLRLAGFVASARGQAGGYTLARPADQIKVAEVLEALGGRLYSPSFCERHSGLDRSCNHSVDCAIRALWGTVQAVLDEVLRNTTLSDLAHSEIEVREWIARRVAAVEKAGVAAGAGSSQR